MGFIEEIKKKDLKYIKLVSTIPSIDNCLGEVSLYDFSRANFNIESRIEAVTLVASTCYASTTSINKEALFNRLSRESMGLPSSSFEFIPIVLTQESVDILFELYEKANIENTELMPFLKYGYFNLDYPKYVFTNYRALLTTYNILQEVLTEDISYILHWFNNEEEIEAIKKFFNVFLSKIDLNTRSQYVRHREASWQELSRRYTSNTKEPIEFYVGIGDNKVIEEGGSVFKKLREHNETSLNLYDELVSKGVAVQYARRVLPQSMYTIIWSGWYPEGLENFFSLRLDNHAQFEIRELAKAKLDLIRLKNSNKEN